MNFLVQPGGALSGTIRVPGDKSISHRAVMLASIAEGRSRISGFLDGEDCLCTMRAFRAMGVGIVQGGPTELEVRGAGLRGLREPGEPLYLGNSGTSMRLMTGLLAAQQFDSTLTGDASLSRRPMRRVIEPLSRMGARIDADDGHAPLRIRRSEGLRGIHWQSPVASAQVKSALLLAGLYASGTTEISEPEASRDHTERMLRSFGVEVEARPGHAAVAGGGEPVATDIRVPGDISSAAFFMVGAAIVPGSEILLQDIGVNPTRTGIVDVLRRMGADIEILNRRDYGAEPVADIRVRGQRLEGVTIGRELVAPAIDEFPVLFVAAACAQGVTQVTGAEELRVKESDRIRSMCDGLGALGIDAQARPDGVRITGGTLSGGMVDSRGDHRIAMSFAMAALRARSPVSVLDCVNVNTSFPGFAGIARHAGLGIREADTT